MEWDEMIVAIRLAQASIDRELGVRVDEVQERLTDGTRAALEACDRAILDVADESVRRELERAVDDLDRVCAGVASAIDEVCTHDLFDPLRVLAADVRHEQARPSPFQLS